MSTFFEQVENATKSYFCSISNDAWFGGAMLLAASGQGAGAAAVTAGGLAANMLCERPKLPPGGLQEPVPGQIQEVFDTGTVPSGTYQVYFKWSRITYVGLCTNFEQDSSQGSCGTLNNVVRLQLRYRTAATSQFCPNYYTRTLERRVNNGSWVTFGTCGNFNAFASTQTAWAVRLGDPDPGPPTPPTPGPQIYNINFDLGGVNINNNIKIAAPDFIFAPSGDFILSFPITIQAGPLVYAPVSFNFDLNVTAGTGQPSGGDGYGTKPTGSGPKPPPDERTKECPEIPDPPQISGSWSKADCINGQPLFTPVNWSGQGFAGVADALNKLNQVIGPWQEETYDCNNDLPMEPLFGIPVSEYTGHTHFEPSVTLYFYEPNLLAIEAGRSNRVRRQITIPVAVPPANPNAFLDIEAAFWEGYEWQCGVIVGRAKLPGGAGNVTCQASTAEESLRVLTAVFNRYGQPLDYERGFRYSAGAPPTDTGGKGGLRIQTTVRFQCCSYADMATTYGPVYPAEVLVRGPSQHT